MTLMERVKDALKRGLPANQVAYAYGVSVDLVEKVQARMKERGEL